MKSTVEAYQPHSQISQANTASQKPLIQSSFIQVNQADPSLEKFKAYYQEGDF